MGQYNVRGELRQNAEKLMSDKNQDYTIIIKIPSDLLRVLNLTFKVCTTTVKKYTTRDDEFYNLETQAMKPPFQAHFHRLTN